MDHVFALRTADGIRVSNGEYYGDPETSALMMIDNYNECRRNRILHCQREKMHDTAGVHEYLTLPGPGLSPPAMFTFV
ncbi:hypothetical protein [Photorhabdus asymbiotica]|uniref:hypothetical protein n=1 Tax=Photorhabdus asymbiotica TaxID=291112 RepID=UPI003DA79A8B